MHFSSPWMLALLVLVPLLALAYVAAQRRRARFALRYSSLLIVHSAAGRPPVWRRHLSAILVLLALAAMIVAIARPSMEIPHWQQEKIVILAMDVSASMAYRDVQPSRLDAAKTAATEFLAQQDATTRVGVVAFSHSAALVQAPTADRESAAQAIQRLKVDSSTAIGSGILTALKAISDEQGAPVLPPASATTPPPAPAPALSSAIIILLTDGQNTAGSSPTDAAEEAARNGVRVFTIGIGSPPGTTTNGDSQKDLDEATLKQIADATQAQYFRAFDESALSAIYRNLGEQTALRIEPVELTPALLALATLLVLVSTTIAFRRFSGLP